MLSKRLIRSTVLMALLFFIVSCLSCGLYKGGFHYKKRTLNNTSYGYQIIDDPTGSAPATKVEKFEVRSGDCSYSSTWNDCKTDRERSEINTNQHTGEKWYTWSIYFPKEFKTVGPALVAAGQFYQPKVGPAYMFMVDEQGYSLFKIPMDYNYLINSEDLKGKWHKIEMHARWSNSSDGFIKIWVNGEKKVDNKGKTTSHRFVYFKYGIYRMNVSEYQETYGKEIPTQIIYFSNVKMAKSREGLSPSP